MKRSLLIALASALALPAPTAAKWIDKATITGPGLDVPVVAGEELFDPTGFYAAALGQWPDGMLDASPTKQLGPKYTITYSLPGPTGGVVRQELYPYAAGGPVTYTKAGQRVFDWPRTRGGWYVAPPGFKETLVSLGLPRTAPGASGQSNQRIWMLAPLGALFLAALPLVAHRPRA